MAERIDVLFGVETLEDPLHIVSDGGIRGLMQIDLASCIDNFCLREGSRTLNF